MQTIDPNDIAKQQLSMASLTACLVAMAQRHCELFDDHFIIPTDVRVKMPVKPMAVLTEYDTEEPFVEICLVPLDELPYEGNMFDTFPGLFQVFYLLYHKLTSKDTIDTYALRHKPLITNPVVNPRPNGVRIPTDVFETLRLGVLHETLRATGAAIGSNRGHWLRVETKTITPDVEASLWNAVSVGDNLWQLAERVASDVRIATAELQPKEEARHG